MVVVGEKPVLAGGVYSGVVRYYRRRYVGAWVSYVGVFSLCWWRALKAVGRQWRRAINENMHITTGRNSLSVVGERLSGCREGQLRRVRPFNSSICLICFVYNKRTPHPQLRRRLNQCDAHALCILTCLPCTCLPDPQGSSEETPFSQSL